MKDKSDKNICIPTEGVNENNFLEKLEELVKSVTPWRDTYRVFSQKKIGQIPISQIEVSLKYRSALPKLNETI